MSDKIPFRHTWWVDLSTGAIGGIASGAIGFALVDHPLWQWPAEIVTFVVTSLGLTQFYAVKQWGHSWRGYPIKRKASR